MAICNTKTLKVKKLLGYFRKKITKEKTNQAVYR